MKKLAFGSKRASDIVKDNNLIDEGFDNNGLCIECNGVGVVFSEDTYTPDICQNCFGCCNLSVMNQSYNYCTKQSAFNA